MSWNASLELHYPFSQGELPRTTLQFRHQGPLRVLQSLYPEGPAICHNVLVHPPGGLVEGDVLDIQVHLAPRAHALLTTPGATRFYRSTSESATQRLHATLEDGAKLEWFPLEAIAYNGCQARNEVRFSLQGQAQVMGWDVTALGLATAGQPFERGWFSQELCLENAWLEKGLIRADDEALMNGPLGLAGQRCMGTLFFLSGQALHKTQTEAALEAARGLLEAAQASCTTGTSPSERLIAGATQPHPQVLVLRVLGPVVEPVMGLLRQVRRAWRPIFWGLEGCEPRVWNT